MIFYGYLCCVSNQSTLPNSLLQVITGIIASIAISSSHLNQTTAPATTQSNQVLENTTVIFPHTTILNPQQITLPDLQSMLANTAIALNIPSHNYSSTENKGPATKKVDPASNSNSTKAHTVIPPAILKDAKAFAIAHGLQVSEMKNFETELVTAVKANPSLGAVVGIALDNKKPLDGAKGKETGGSAVGVGAGTMPSSVTQPPLQIPEALTNALNTIPSLPPGVGSVANLPNLPANFNPANAAAAWAAFQEFLRTHSFPPLPPGPPPPPPP